MLSERMFQVKKYKYLIIGGSVATVAAVEGIREIDGDGSIGVVSYEPYHAYSRPMISNYLMDDIELEDMYYRPLKFYEKEKVDSLLGKTVVKVSPDEKKVFLDDGDCISYERLLVSSGGRPIIPRINGVDKKGVYRFLSLDNAREIKASLKGLERVVIIGGGLSGMKAAEAIISIGVRVSVIEMMERVLKPVYDETACGIIKALFEDKGVDVLTSSQAEEIYGRKDDESSAGGVMLKGGKKVDGDIVIMSVGVIPQVDFLKDSGIEINRGVVVDKSMKTNLPDIYAAGDVAEAYDILLGINRPIPIWPKAYYEGRIAGLNMAGGNEEFSGIFAMNSADFFGLPTMSAGIVNPEDDSWESLVEFKPEENYYKRIVLKNNKIDGMIMVGDAVDRAGIILGLIKDRIDVKDFKDKLLDKGFSIADLPASVKRARIRDVALA